MAVLTFNDIVGNITTITLLRRALQNGKLPKFIILHGMMGTGKTSVAKALSLAITCENPVMGEACLVCRNCKQTLSSFESGGSSTTVVHKNMALVKRQSQMDDLIRNIFQLLQGTAGQNVYSLGEIHAISKEYQETLLEELDSMPENVTVIATTTSLRQLIPPLVSRAVPYRFGRLSEAELRLLFDKTVKDLGIKAPSNEVRSLLIRNSRGVARDLVKMINFTNDSSPTIEELRSHLGYVNDSVYLSLFGAIQGTLQEFMRVLSHCLDQTPLEDFVPQAKRFLEKVLFSLEGVNSEELSAADRKKSGEILTTEQWYKISFFFERLNSNSLDEDGFRLSMIKLKQTVNNKKGSDTFAQNARAASVEKVEAQQNALDEKIYQESRAGEAAKPLSLDFADKFNTKPGGV